MKVKNVTYYTYDDNYQLTHANGDWGGQIGYDLTMQYSPAGRILNKRISGDKYSQGVSIPITYDNAYDYGANNNPYALKQIIDNNTGEEHHFDWDDKGNMTRHYNVNQGNERRLCWTEDNRLQAVQDYNIGAYYGYDSQGERGLKLTGPSIQINQNGYIYHVSALKEQTLYASPLITINDKGYTKHYFEEGKRICSKIGSGELRDINDLVGHMEMNYEEQLTTQYEGIKGGSMSCFGGGWFDLENNNLYKSIIQPYEGPMNPDEPSFYYHSDHLGSASFLTDTNGIETQELVYLPFGEDWVDMKYNTGQYDTPYKFNGKEKDEETGYNNYGARYYYDWASIWLSVDPMSDKYPNESNYVYCSNNPVIYIDPNGEEKLNWIPRNGSDDDRAVAKAVDKYKNDGAIHIYSHGAKNGMWAEINGKSIKITTPEKLNALLNKHSDTWKNREEGDNLTIVLHACKTGQGENSFAEKLSESEEFKDVNIIAPTEKDWMGDNKEAGTYKPIPQKDENGNNKKNGGRRSDVKGNWVTFKNGEKTDTHKGDWKPRKVEE